MVPSHDAKFITYIVTGYFTTGESLPVTKTPLPQDANMKYSSDECKRHTLYNGTEIIQTRAFGHAEVLAVVIHTGNYIHYMYISILLLQFFICTITKIALIYFYLFKALLLPKDPL